MVGQQHGLKLHVRDDHGLYPVRHRVKLHEEDSESCCTCLPLASSGSYTYGVEDVEEAFAGGQAVVGVDALHSSHREEHPDGGPESKEDGGFVVQLRVVC